MKRCVVRIEIDDGTVVEDEISAGLLFYSIEEGEYKHGRGISFTKGSLPEPIQAEAMIAAYSNMREFVRKHKEMFEHLEEAVNFLGESEGE